MAGSAGYEGISAYHTGGDSLRSDSRSVSAYLRAGTRTADFNEERGAFRTFAVVADLCPMGQRLRSGACDLCISNSKAMRMGKSCSHGARECRGRLGLVDTMLWRACLFVKGIDLLIGREWHCHRCCRIDDLEGFSGDMLRLAIADSLEVAELLGNILALDIR